MKKAVCIVLILFLVGFSIFGGGNRQTGSSKTVKIGYTILSLQDVYFSNFFKEFESLCKAKGWQLTTVGCNTDPGTQITQIENFITSGMSVIIAQPADPNALTEDVVKTAHEKGVIMMGHGISYQAADTNMVDDNFACGKAVGIAAAKWAREVYGDQEVEAGMFEYPYIKEAIDRNEGILAGLAESSSKIKIVSTVAAFGVTEGMSAAESILQAHPNIKIFLNITDGTALGACETLEALGVDPGKYAVFGIDATEEALVKIETNTPFKMTVSKGLPKQNALMVSNIVEELLAGTHKKLYMNPTITVDKTNYKDFLQIYRE
jgi:ABC-type sugar transport system substrate-binding protein